MRIFSFDPGKGKHFAYSIIDSNGTCVEYGLIPTMQDLKGLEFQKERKKFSDFFILFFQKHNFDQSQDVIVAERYMYRPGMGKGASSEFINIMIGVLASIVPDAKFILTPAAVWKNHFRKRYGFGEDNNYKNLLEFLIAHYAESVKKGIHGRKLQIHEADAIGIGMWFFEKQNNLIIINKLWANMIENHSNIPVFLKKDPNVTNKSKSKPKSKRKKKIIDSVE